MNLILNRESETSFNSLFKSCFLDSDVMDFPVARITDSNISLNILKELLKHLKSINIKLAYWPSPINASKMSHGKECIKTVYSKTKNINYEINIKNMIKIEKPVHPDIEKYMGNESCRELDSLAAHCNTFSHLTCDPGILKDHADIIYRHWIRESIDDRNSSELLVAVSDSKIIGMVSFSWTNKTGRINLIAVNRDMRRMGWGCSLVNAAISKLFNLGIEKIGVETQDLNTPAKKLYEKCDFRPISSQYMNHFWL